MLKLVQPDRDAVAAVEFVHDGKTYAAGEMFPHKALAVHPNALRGLTYAGLIRFVEADTAPVSAQASAVTPPPQRPAHKHRR